MLIALFVFASTKTSHEKFGTETFADKMGGVDIKNVSKVLIGEDCYFDTLALVWWLREIFQIMRYVQVCLQKS